MGMVFVENEIHKVISEKSKVTNIPIIRLVNGILAAWIEKVDQVDPATQKSTITESVEQFKKMLEV